MTAIISGMKARFENKIVFALCPLVTLWLRGKNLRIKQVMVSIIEKWICSQICEKGFSPRSLCVGKELFGKSGFFRKIRKDA